MLDAIDHIARKRDIRAYCSNVPRQFLYQVPIHDYGVRLGNNFTYLSDNFISDII